MSPEQPLAPEPARLSPLRSTILTSTLAFAVGALIAIGAVVLSGGSLGPRPAPPPVTIAAPAPAPAAAVPPGTDIAALYAREQALSGQIDGLEARLRDMDASARNAASYATQAERLMVAFAVRRAIERGMPLGPLDGQLRRRFAERHAEAVATIAQAAGQPVTLEDLRLALDAIGPRLVAAPNDSWWTTARRMIGDLVVLRQADTPSPRAADRLKRARRMLGEGQVEGALAEVAHMPGVGEAESWVAAARRYIAARTALREIELAAMETPQAAAPATPGT